VKIMEKLTSEYIVSLSLSETEIRDFISEGIKCKIKNITKKMPMGITFKKEEIRLIKCKDSEIMANIFLTYGDTICSED